MERYTAIHGFIELYPCVVGALDKISEWKDSASTDANILAKSMDSEFFVSLQVIKVTIIMNQDFFFFILQFLFYF